jgi:rhamnopyranosyl-N-acetylglucosaminyl-diphospho-decaprenol beta-1,3/1,4-galactofuranosyltransferase
MNENDVLSTTAAIVVTFNRSELLRRTLATLLRQTRPLDDVIVVDNGGSDGTDQVIPREFPSIRYLRLPENRGPGAAFGEGMELALRLGHRWTWMMNDDSFPDPRALEQLGRALERSPGSDVGVICCRATGQSPLNMGALWNRGRPVYLAKQAVALEDGVVHSVDIANFAGALVRREVVETVGLPTPDYFLMFEDYEYSLRIRRAGFRILVATDSVIDHLHAGSGDASSWSPPWRGYYQTRNHLYFLLHQRRSLEGLGFWMTRNGKLLVATALQGDQKLDRIRLRLLGAWHGLRGRTGKTIDPVTYRAGRT